MTDFRLDEFKSGLVKSIDLTHGNLLNDVLRPDVSWVGSGLMSAGEHISLLGFPRVDLTGFDQEAPYKSQGGLSDLWHGIKHLFVRDETVEERLRSTIESKMTPAEKKQFEQEKSAMEEYERQIRTRSVMMMINPPPLPEPPVCPMHNEIEKRVAQMEKQIAEKVRESMSPQDRARLDRQFDEYQKAFKEATTIHNPLGTGEGFKPLPKPGTAIQDFYTRVAEATEAYLSGNS